MHASRISNIHLRFHEILDFSAFLDVFRTYWIVSPPSSDVSIVPDVYGRQLVGRDEVGHYPEDQNGRTLSRGFPPSMTAPGPWVAAIAQKPLSTVIVLA